MAFHITVRRLADPSPPNPPESGEGDAIDEWLAQCTVGELYSAPLGAQQIVYSWWYLPAQRLSLQLIGRIYPDGLDVFGSSVNDLAAELNLLEQDWVNSDLESEQPLNWRTVGKDGTTTEGQIALRDHLRGRAAYLREAIITAQTQGGVITIA